VPVGTTIYDSKTKEIIVDILKNGQTFLICKGGKAGHGNSFFKSSFNRIPTLHERGDLGETKEIIMKIRFLVDVAIVGLPNAGKSTLITNISNAKPKIGNYEFTTLSPVLGTVKYKNNTLVFEDVPGLIEGASEGRGLGIEFLKHIERSYVLIHLISLSQTDNPDIVTSYKTIVNELTKYKNKLDEKPLIIVGNKIDKDDCEKNLNKLQKHLKTKIFTISAINKTNINELIQKIFLDYFKIINKLKKQKINIKAKKIVKIRRKDEVDKIKKDAKITLLSEGYYEVNSEYLTY
jgi:GTP-binding protein